MRKILVLVLIIVSFTASAAFAADDCCDSTTNSCFIMAQAPAAPLEQTSNGQSATGLIPPPPIYTPFGGKIVTELHFSNNDILGIIRQVIPAIGKALREDSTNTMLSSIDPHLSALSKVDYETLMEATSDIRNIRFILVRYNRKLDTDQLLQQFDLGAAKAGAFSKVISSSDDPYNGIVAVYAQPDNSGYISYLYQPYSRELVAFRVVGSLDYAKLTNWAIETGKIFYAMFTPIVTNETQTEED